MQDFKFDWDPRLELGIFNIDEQHQYFFQLGRYIEQLLLRRCMGVSDQDLLNLLYELRDYITYHFYDEEKLMAQIHYPQKELQLHKKAHEGFTTYINGIDYTKLCQNPFEELTIIYDHLAHWVFNHMIQEDQKIAPYYKAAQQSTK